MARGVPARRARRPRHLRGGRVARSARVEACATAGEPLTLEELSSAFWCACHGGRLATAQYLYGLGADPDRVGYGDRTPLDIAREQNATDVVEWLSAVTAKPLGDSA
ncbi:ankyrin repeat domain-containing protein [Streptomyces sp. NPDC055059]